MSNQFDISETIKVMDVKAELRDGEQVVDIVLLYRTESYDEFGEKSESVRMSSSDFTPWITQYGMISFAKECMCWDGRNMDSID